MKKHFINSIVEYYPSGADVFERSYIRTMGESLILSALGGIGIYSGFSHISPLEVSVGASAFFSSFGFLEVSATQLLRRYETKQIASSIQ